LATQKRGEILYFQGRAKDVTPSSGGAEDVIDQDLVRIESLGIFNTREANKAYLWPYNMTPSSQPQTPHQQVRSFWILRFFVNRYNEEPREKPVFVHDVCQSVQRMMDVTLRDDDIKVCVTFLADKELLETHPVGYGVAYRISEKGFEEFQKSRGILSTILLWPR
jgi:hypothetical protein